MIPPYASEEEQGKDGRSPTSQGRAATASPPSPKTVSGIAGIPNAVLPCDVLVPPSTTIRAGCKYTTLIDAIEARREGGPHLFSADRRRSIAEARAEAFERALRIRIWNECRGKGMSDVASYQEISGEIIRIVATIPFASAMSAGTAETAEQAQGRSPASAVAESETPIPFTSGDRP